MNTTPTNVTSRNNVTAAASAAVAAVPSAGAQAGAVPVAGSIPGAGAEAKVEGDADAKTNVKAEGDADAKAVPVSGTNVGDKRLRADYDGGEDESGQRKRCKLPVLFEEGRWYAPHDVKDNGVCGGPGKNLLLLLDRAKNHFFCYNNWDGGGSRVTLSISSCGNKQSEQVCMYGVTYRACDKAVLCAGTPVVNTCKKLGVSATDSSEAIMTELLLKYKPEYV